MVNCSLFAPVSNTPQRPTEARAANGSRAWFCVYTHPKREQIAAASLAQQELIEVLLPRIRYRRPGGPIDSWITEPLFPRYVFARFGPCSIRRVRHARGVRDIVHFGNRWPTIPDSVLEELRQWVGPQALCIAEQEFRPGEQVEIAGGPLQGLEAIISRFHPQRHRAQALLQFLGRQTTIVIDSRQLLPAEPTVRRFSWSAAPG